MSRRNMFGHKTGRAGVKCYRAAGKMFGQSFSSGHSCPEIRAICCRCEGVCFVRSVEHMKDGITLAPCYGCIKEMASQDK